MKIGLVASMMIAGLLWIAVIQLNHHFYASTGTQTMQHMEKIKNESFITLLERDLMRMGFGVSGHGLVAADSSIVSFETDFENNGVIKTVSWYKAVQDSSASPLRYVLIRETPDGAMDYDLNVKDFYFEYLNNQMEPAADLGEIRHVRYFLITEAKQGFGLLRERHAISRTLTPRNLELGL